MESGWWTVRRWPASRPSASPQLLPQFSVWPGFHQHQECSSLEVKKKKKKRKSASPGVFEPSGVFYHKVVKEPFEVLSVCVCLRSRFSFACGDIFQEKKKKESWDSLLCFRVRIRINPKGLHLKRSSHLCVCVCQILRWEFCGCGTSHVPLHWTASNWKRMDFMPYMSSTHPWPRKVKLFWTFN